MGGVIDCYSGSCVTSRTTTIVFTAAFLNDLRSNSGPTEKPISTPQETQSPVRLETKPQVEPVPAQDVIEPVFESQEPEGLMADQVLPTEPTAAGPLVGLPGDVRFIVHFDFESNRPKSLSKVEVDDLVKSVGHCRSKIRVTGHTCNLGNNEVNLRLGLARAEAVKKLLLAKGFSDQEIETVSEGENQPIASNDTLEGRAKNRRAELSCLD